MADLPYTEDGFNRKYYADSLWSIIWSTFTNQQVKNAAFTILLNEKYGSGKSSFFNILRKSINEQAYIIDFKPWLCSDETQMIDELIEQLIGANVIEEHKMLMNYANTLANHDSWVGVIGKIFTSTYSVSLNDQYDAIKEKMKLISNNPVKRIGLEGYGLNVEENVPIEIEPNEYNRFYMQTKKPRMGHDLHKL